MTGERDQSKETLERVDEAAPKDLEPTDEESKDVKGGLRRPVLLAEQPPQA
jgi:hypothetical protein